MPSILKKDKKTTLRKRNVSDLSVKIETVQEKKVSFDTAMKTLNESFFESVWPGKVELKPFITSQA